MIVILQQPKYGGRATLVFVQNADMAGLIRAMMDQTGDVEVYDVQVESVAKVYPSGVPEEEVTP